MKRLLCFVCFIVFLLVLSGCNKRKVDFVLEPFASEVEIISDGSVFRGVFVFESENRMHIDFTSADCVEGIRVDFIDSQYNYACDDVTVTVPSEAENLQVFGIFEAVELLAASEGVFAFDKEGTVTLSDKGISFSYTIDVQSGRLMSIESSEGEINFRYR